MAEAKTQKPLDPGPATRRKSTFSCARCCIYTVFIIACITVGIILLLISIGVRTTFNEIRNPHAAQYHNGAGATESAMSSVGPLVDRDQLFDIVATIWIRAPEQEEKTWKSTLPPLPAPFRRPESSDAKTSTQIAVVDERVLARPLFSDFVFRGLRMSDKRVFTDVEFQLPTARFASDTPIDSLDLRASFVLIPASPSPIERIVNYSTWLPDSIIRLPNRAWPFPLHSDARNEPTLADEALDACGFSISLLEFKEVAQRCPSSVPTSTASSIAQPTQPRSALDDDEETDEPALTFEDRIGGIKDMVEKAAYQRHPHIVARTQLRMMQETRLFDLRAYNSMHRRLRETACRPLSLFTSNQPKRMWCTRDYKNHGHFGTRMEVENVVNGELRTEWLYSPYLDTLPRGRGTKDLIPIPVSRENCTIPANGTAPEIVLPRQDTEYMNVTWHLSFSGRSHLKAAFADSLVKTFAPQHELPVNSSEYVKAHAHRDAELLYGFLGHSFRDDSHPRLGVVLSTLKVVMILGSSLLSLHYWCTRTTTIGISIAGTALSTLSSLIDSTAAAFIDSNIIWCILYNSSTILIYKTILRLEWAPKRMFSRRASHRERASQRLEDGILAWRYKLLLLAVFTMYCYYFPRGHAIFPSVGPEPTAVDVADWHDNELVATFVMPLATAGSTLQIMLNHRAKTFAGSYKSAVIMWLAASLLTLVEFGVIREPGVRNFFSSNEVLVTVLPYAILTWQAMRYPAVSQDPEDEDEK